MTQDYLNISLQLNLGEKRGPIRVFYKDPRVLVGNWVEDRIECPKESTFYFPPKETIDYEKMKPEIRRPDFRRNKLNGSMGNVLEVIRHDSHSEGNFVSTNDLVYNHLPKPYCGPIQRTYNTSEHQYMPQPDLMKSYGNLTDWGLRRYKNYEWACNNIYDYSTTLYEDTFTAPMLSQYPKAAERKGRSSVFTRTFRFKMTKPLKNPKKKN